MKEKINAKATSLIGKYVKYGTQFLTVDSYRIDEDTERIYIYTSLRKQPFDRPLGAAMEFMREFKEVEEGEVIPQAVATQPVLPQHIQQPAPLTMLGSNTLVKELKDVLLDNITKLKENKDYLPQAEAINAQVNTLIDLGKTEIAYMMASAKLHNL